MISLESKGLHIILTRDVGRAGTVSFLARRHHRSIDPDRLLRLLTIRRRLIDLISDFDSLHYCSKRRKLAIEM